MNPKVVVVMTTMSQKWNEISIPDLHESTAYPFDLISVQDKDTPESSESIKKLAGEYDFFHMGFKRRMGISNCWNAGIAVALDNEAEYVVILNNDIVFPPIKKDGKCWLTLLVEWMEEHSDYGLVSPGWYMDSETQYDEFKQHAWGFADQNADDLAEGMQGRFFILRSDALHDMREIEGRTNFEPVPGMFDATRYPCQWEDADFQYRMRKLGWRTGITYSVVLAHKGSGTLGDDNNPYRKKFTTENIIGMYQYLRKWELPMPDVGKYHVNNAIYRWKVGEKEYTHDPLHQDSGKG